MALTAGQVREAIRRLKPDGAELWEEIRLRRAMIAPIPITMCDKTELSSHLKRKLHTVLVKEQSSPSQVKELLNTLERLNGGTLLGNHAPSSSLPRKNPTESNGGTLLGNHAPSSSESNNVWKQVCRLFSGCRSSSQPAYHEVTTEEPNPSPTTVIN